MDNRDTVLHNVKLIQAVDTEKAIDLPIIERLKAGFPSPASDYVEGKLDLNKKLIQNPESTYYVHVVGDSMIGAGINDGDILIVDSSLEARSGSIIVAELDQQYTVKRLVYRGDKIYLVPENPAYPEIEIKSTDDFEIWGVVTSSIHVIV